MLKSIKCSTKRLVNCAKEFSNWNSIVKVFGFKSHLGGIKKDYEKKLKSEF